MDLDRLLGDSGFLGERIEEFIHASVRMWSVRLMSDQEWIQENGVEECMMESLEATVGGVLAFLRFPGKLEVFKPFVIEWIMDVYSDALLDQVKEDAVNVMGLSPSAVEHFFDQLTGGEGVDLDEVDIDPDDVDLAELFGGEVPEGLRNGD